MRDPLHVIEVTQLPTQTPFNRSAIYRLKTGLNDAVDLYLSNDAGTKLSKLVTEDGVKDIVDGVIQSSDNAIIVKTIADRDLLKPTSVIEVLVLDASADTNVKTGRATYLFDKDSKTWIKTSEPSAPNLSSDVLAILNKPSSISYEYTGNLITKVTEVIAGNSRVTEYTYDSGNLVSEKVTYQGKVRTETYSYTNGAITSMTAVET